MIGAASSRRVATAAAVFVAIVTLCLVAAGCGGGSDDGSQSEESMTATSDSASAAASDETGLPVLLDLGSTTCVPCKTMAPILDEMRETFAGQFDVRFVNVKEDATLAREYGVRIIPTQIYLDDKGNELFRHQGFFSREDMLAAWGELGYVFEE